MTAVAMQLEGSSWSAIADYQDVRENAARKAVNRGRRKLQEYVLPI